MKRRTRALAVSGVFTVAAVTAAGCGASAQPGGEAKPGQVTQITIAAQDFSEPLIDDYIIKDLIEAKTSIRVTVKKTSGASGLMHSMLQQGDIQMYLGYDGTEFTGPLKQSYTGEYAGHPDKVTQYVKDQEMKQFHAWVSPSLGYEDTYALAVTEQTAEKDHLKTVSDAVPYAKDWVLATDSTFQARQGDGLPGFEQAYGIQFKSAKSMSYDMMYPALQQGAVDAAIVYSTDGRLKKLHEVPLVDDKHFFPPYHAVIIADASTVQAAHLDQVLAPLWGAITTDDQIQMNYEVDVLKKNPADVAHEFLVHKGLIQG
ncbi:MAG: hypothetical protein K6T81_09075 [Alicyclobacillus macrosporangiidus]|uniref:ABC transporter substrate-binding protein n=1 Tax=Alicyclobacillus macrosporangiidus TaxID=392015 RepID=UPI0026EE442B|nr:glycine betaine ABC transporter substrate-binding protein [Alicyclobacillus macrosporangiidus]MCL6598881.1 hypothetical protein [Alicyclobacillus macrosporangiidus]